jgi:hypothetical protein
MSEQANELFRTGRLNKTRCGRVTPLPCALFASSELLECNSGVFRNECVREVVKMSSIVGVCARALKRVFNAARFDLRPC